MLPHPFVRALARAAGAFFVVALLTGCRPRATPVPDATSPPTAASVPTPVPPPSPAARIEDEKNTISIFRAAAPSTVFVTQTRVVEDFFAGVIQEVPAGSGSGFVWDDKGHVVTNYHVVEGAQSLTVTFHDQQTFDAKVVGVEPRKDIAVLKVDAPAKLLSPVNVAKTTVLEVGQKTVAIGNPFGLDFTLTTGIVSALGRQVQGVGGVTIRDMIQTDAAINPGNSGGPLLDSSGQLIGMNTMIYSKSGSSAGIGFAVPVTTISRIVPQIIKTGRAEQVGLSIVVDPQQRLERRVGVHGVLVLSVPADSPAAKVGLRATKRTPQGILLGDIILKVDDRSVDSYDDLYSALDVHKAGDVVRLTVRRGETTAEVDVKLVLLAHPSLI